jgi:hypothetical protein
MSNLPLEAPPEEDSPDLTDAEISSATDTVDSNDFVRTIEEVLRPMVRPNVGFSIQGHELRRRKPHLYCRTRVGLDGEPDKVLVFRVDWLQKGG